MHVCMYEWMEMCARMYICKYVFMYLCMYGCVCARACTWAYTEMRVCVTLKFLAVPNAHTCIHTYIHRFATDRARYCHCRQSHVQFHCDSCTKIFSNTYIYTYKHTNIYTCHWSSSILHCRHSHAQFHCDNCTQIFSNTYIHTNIHACMHTQVCHRLSSILAFSSLTRTVPLRQLHKNIQQYMHTFIHTYIHTYIGLPLIELDIGIFFTHTRNFTATAAQKYSSLMMNTRCVYVCMYVYIYIYIYIYIHTHTCIYV